MNANQALVTQVGEEDADDADRQVQVGSELSDRHRQAAQLEQTQVLGFEIDVLARGTADGSHQRDQVDGGAARPGSAGGERVGSNDWTGARPKPLLSPRFHPGSRGLRAGLCWSWPHTEVLTDSLNQECHLIGDQPGVGLGAGEDRQAAAFARGRDEQEGRLQLDDRLSRAASAEVLSESSRQALEPGGHGGQMLRVFPAESG